MFLFFTSDAFIVNDMHDLVGLLSNIHLYFDSYYLKDFYSSFFILEQYQTNTSFHKLVEISVILIDFILRTQ